MINQIACSLTCDYSIKCHMYKWIVSKVYHPPHYLVYIAFIYKNSPFSQFLIWSLDYFSVWGYATRKDIMCCSFRWICTTHCWRKYCKFIKRNESWLSTGAQTLPLLLFVCPLLRVSYSLMQNNEQEKYLCDIYIA